MGTADIPPPTGRVRGRSRGIGNLDGPLVVVRGGHGRVVLVLISLERQKDIVVERLDFRICGDAMMERAEIVARRSFKLGRNFAASGTLPALVKSMAYKSITFVILVLWTFPSANKCSKWHCASYRKSPFSWNPIIRRDIPDSKRSFGLFFMSKVWPRKSVPRFYVGIQNRGLTGG